MDCITVKDLLSLLEKENPESLILLSFVEGSKRDGYASVGEQAHEIHTGILLGNKQAILIVHKEWERESLYE